MPRYETVFVAASSVPEDAVEAIVSGLESVVSDGGGILHKTERWGRRRLAYPVRKNREGNYTLFLYDSESSVVNELERRIRMNDRVIRYLTVRRDTAKLPTQEEKDELATRRDELRRRAEERAKRRQEAARLAEEAGEEFSVEEWERQADEDERRRAREQAAAREAAEAAEAAGVVVPAPAAAPARKPGAAEGPKPAAEPEAAAEETAPAAKADAGSDDAAGDEGGAEPEPAETAGEADDKKED